MAKGDKSKGTTKAAGRKTTASKGEIGGMAKKPTATPQPAKSPSRAAAGRSTAAKTTAQTTPKGGMTSRSAAATTKARTPGARPKASSR